MTIVKCGNTVHIVPVIALRVLHINQNGSTYSPKALGHCPTEILVT
jgi:hypothetical protein